MRALDLAARLNEAIDTYGMPKLEFARKLQVRRSARRARGEPTLRKVDRSALYAILDGGDVPPVDTLAEMAEILEVRLGWLEEGEDPRRFRLP